MVDDAQTFPASSMNVEAATRTILKFMADLSGTQRVLREREVARMTGLSVSSIRNRCDPYHASYDPEFPLPRALGSGKNRSAIGWIHGEILHWVNTRPVVALTHQVNGRPKGRGRSRTRDSASIEFSI